MLLRTLLALAALALPALVHSQTQPIRVGAFLSVTGPAAFLGEQMLEQSGAEYLLIRTSWVYAPWGKNFVRTILGAARTKPVLRVVDDQLGRPSSAEQLAETTLALLDAGGRGTFHGSDGGQCTWFELARAVVAEAGLDCRVDPCSSAEYPSSRNSASLSWPTGGGAFRSVPGVSESRTGMPTSWISPTSGCSVRRTMPLCRICGSVNTT